MKTEPQHSDITCTRHQLYVLGVIAERPFDGVNIDASRKGVRLNEARIMELVEKGLVRITKKRVGRQWLMGRYRPVHERTVHATTAGLAYIALAAGGAR